MRHTARVLISAALAFVWVVLPIAALDACVNRETCATPMTSHCNGQILHLCGTDLRSRPAIDCAAVRAGTEGERIVCCTSAASGRDNCLPAAQCLATTTPTR